MEVLVRPASISDALVEDERIEARCLEVLMRPAPIPEDTLSEKYPIVSQLLPKCPIPAKQQGHVAASQQQRHVAQQQQQRAADAAEEQQRRFASSRAAAARSLRKCQESNSSSSSSSGMLPPATPYAAMLRQLQQQQQQRHVAQKILPTTGKATPKHKAAGVLSTTAIAPSGFICFEDGLSLERF